MPYRLEDSPGFAIYRTDMRIRLLGAQLLRPYGVTPEQFAALAALFSRDGMSQTELADHLVKDRPNTSRIVDKLEQKGWVKRRLDPEDRRVYRLYVTEEGRSLVEEVVPIALAAREKMFGCLSREERSTLRRLLDRVLNALE